MANFATHAVGGAVLGGCLGVAAWVLGDINFGWSLGLAGVTWAASLAPDLDARSSIPARWLWDGVSVGFAAWWVFCVPLAQVSVLRVFCAALCGLLIRGPISHWMMRFARHRGIFHSVQVGVILGCLVGILGDRVMGASERVQLCIGMGTLLGFLLHLVLDEAFSVDLNNVRIRRSFGTALKVWDRRVPGLSLGVSVGALFGVVLFLGRFL